MKSPVLLLVFNRPETTRQVFDAVRAARPPRLYIAADGPRGARSGEAQRCDEVRRIVAAVDWPCDVKTLFRDRNLGCKIGVASGIDWFFAHEPEGIILEDDILPVGTFFDFCDELLARYRHEDRVWMISGSNLIAKHFEAKDSYFFSRYTQIWGWASWRRAWLHYDVRMAEWPAWRDSKGLKGLSDGSRLFEIYWRHTFNACHDGKRDTWDYQWTFACWRAGGLAVLPAVNQTHNVGFGMDATHTTAAVPKYVSSSPVQPMKFPLVHPKSLRRDAKADQLMDSLLFGIDIQNFLRRVPRLAYSALKQRTLGLQQS
jgi:hypothetical protein